MLSTDGKRVVEIESHNDTPNAWVQLDPTPFPRVVTGYGSPGWCATVWEDQAPDLTDPATLGCLLELVREAWQAPKTHALAQTARARRWGQAHASPLIGPRGNAWICYVYAAVGLEPIERFLGKTEAEALVAALEAAL